MLPGRFIEEAAPRCRNVRAFQHSSPSQRDHGLSARKRFNRHNAEIFFPREQNCPATRVQATEIGIRYPSAELNRVPRYAFQTRVFRAAANYLQAPSCSDEATHRIFDTFVG